MTSRVTFGDFATAASLQLDQAVPRPEPAPRRGEASARTRQAKEFTRGLHAVLEVMGGYLADIAAPHAGFSPQERGLLNPWARAAVEARDALGHAAACLPPEADAGRASREETAGPAAGGLDAAAVSMRAGRDLLATHFGTDPDGARRYHSEWAPAVSSVPVTRALLLQIGSWARQIVSQGAILALSPGRPQRGTAPRRRGLSSACQWLAVLDCAVQAAERREPVPDQDVRLLRAIPVNAVPARRVPDGTEGVRALCEGTLGSAERIRHVIWLLAPQASWSPGLTADSLRQSAGCAIVISHHCEILLRSLASRAAWHGDIPLSAGLTESAEAAGTARQAWLRAARTWNGITSDTRRTISPSAAESADLALWTGRLAYADPTWTLERGPSQAIRPAEGLALLPDDIPGVVTAVHHACQTLTQIAAGDQEQIRAAANAGRLLVPTRSLPDTVDVPRPFARAPRGRVDQVLLAYRDAGTTSTRATAAVADVAAAVGARSEVLTSARAAGQADGNDVPASRGHLLARSALMRRQARGEPGRVERALRDLGVISTAVLLRGAAIDRAGNQLIRDNQQAAAERRRRLVPATGRSASANGPAGRLLASTDTATVCSRRPSASAHVHEAEAEL